MKSTEGIELLIKIDLCSKLVWHVDGGFHHSNEKDHEGNIWVPAWSFPAKTKGVNLDINENDISKTNYAISEPNLYAHMIVDHVENDDLFDPKDDIYFEKLNEVDAYQSQKSINLLQTDNSKNKENNTNQHSLSIIDQINKLKCCLFKNVLIFIHSSLCIPSS